MLRSIPTPPIPVAASIWGLSTSGSPIGERRACPIPARRRSHDFTNRLMNNITNNTADPIVSALGGGDLATLRAQREQTNQRMGTGAKVGADILGQFNPAVLANRVPLFGPAIQGGAQEGLRSYAAGNSWPTIATDAGLGIGSGVIGGALNTPKALAQAGSKLADAAVPAALGYLTGGERAVEHGLIGGFLGSTVYSPVSKAIEKYGDKLGELAGPKTQQALQNLLMGGASSAIQSNPPPPPLPFFGYGGF